MNLKAIAFFTLILVSTLLSAQTVIQGTYNNLQLTAAGSPYNVTGTVEIPAGAVIDIAPGVVVNFVGSGEILIHGAIQANGTLAQPIVFNGNNAPNILHISDVNLLDSKISYCHFFGGGNAIFLEGNNTNYLQPNDLLISNSGLRSDANSGGIQFGNSEVVYSTILLRHSLFGSSNIFSFDYCTIRSSTINSIANNGIYTTMQINYTKISDCQFLIQGLTNRFNSVSFTEAEVHNCTFTVKNTNCSFTQCKLKGSPFSLGTAAVATDTCNIVLSTSILVNCDLIGGSILNAPGYLQVDMSSCLYAKGINTISSVDVIKMHGSSIIGTGTGTGIRSFRSKVGASTVVNNTIGVLSLGYREPKFEGMIGSNIFRNSLLNVKIDSSYGYNAEGTWWGTNDSLEIANLIDDFHDNPSKGEVLLGVWASIPNTNPPISPPFEVRDSLVLGGHLISWTTNPEPDLAGYHLHSGNFDGFEYTNVVDLGNVTSVFIPDTSFSNNMSLTAYDVNFSGGQDMAAGRESWYSTISGALPVAVSEPIKTANAALKLYPNPSSGQFSIAYRNAKRDPSEICDLQIIDIAGKLILNSNEIIFPFEVDAKSWPKGIYIARVSSSIVGTSTIKILIQ